jgi:hypothetical protein
MRRGFGLGSVVSSWKRKTDRGGGEGEVAAVQPKKDNNHSGTPKTNDQRPIGATRTTNGIKIPKKNIVKLPSRVAIQSHSTQPTGINTSKLVAMTGPHSSNNRVFISRISDTRVSLV